ncbi:MAG: autotransporter-associated beta strand repeat-containing protein [Pirellulales bacterium]|nr:autotransporter-associated beta strand repeat-containing protein [Pirellulales bacterium]
MKSRYAGFPLSAAVLAALAAAFCLAPALAFDIYNDMPPLLAGWDSNAEIHVHSAAEADAVRQNTVNYLWGGAGLPVNKLPTSTVVYSGGGTLPADLKTLDVANIAAAEKWQANIDFGYSTSMYLLRPVNTANANRLAIVHHGHVGFSGRFNLGTGTLTDHLLKNGFTVLQMQMPLMGWNTQTTFNLPSGTVTLSNHNAMVSTLEGQGGSSLRFFLEPVVQGINKFVQQTPNYADISMFGLSGGGWTTTLAPAIDARIKLSVPVAGSLPLTVRDAYAAAQGYGYNDDAEQDLPAMYVDRAGYLDLYALSGYGAGRKQIQLNNRYDSCCFYGISGQTYADNVKNAVAATGAGSWDYYLDTTVNQHQISSNAVYNVIDPALGISPPKPTAPAINEQFNVASAGPPSGWRYDPTNGTSPPVVISGTGAEAQFSSGGGVKSIVGGSTFDPKSVPITATIRIKSVGGGGYLGMFFTDDPYTRTHHFGLQVKSDGQLILNTDHGGGFKQDVLTTLAGYGGGPITLKLTFDANGFIASTDVGNYTSNRRTFASLTNGKSFSVNDIGMEAFPFLQYYAGTSVGTVDWFTVAPADFTWNQANGGAWSLDANWSAKWSPNGAGVTARFTNSINPGAVVSLNGAATVGKLLFDSAAHYKIAGAATLSLSPGYLGTNRIEVASGSHEIAVPIVLNAPTEVNVATGSTLTLSGIVGGTGNLIKSGAGNLILTQSAAYAGETTVNGGELILLGALNVPPANVNVHGGAVLTAPALVANALTVGGPAQTAVPEPGALALLSLAGVLGGFVLVRFRRRA